LNSSTASSLHPKRGRSGSTESGIKETEPPMNSVFRPPLTQLDCLATSRCC
jgi:hypothetical protein